MSLETQLMEDLKVAMKSKDQAALRGIRAIKSAILLFKTDGSGNELDEAAEIKLVQKLVKQRQDSLAIYIEQNREDLAKVEQEEIDIMMKYLPEQLSEDDIKKTVDETIAALGVSGPQAMGQVIGAVKGKLGNAADGGTIARLVKEAL